MSRADDRHSDALRPLKIECDFLEQPHGSVLFAQGRTIVLCTASIQEGVPRWLMGERFLQFPIVEVEAVSLTGLGAPA